MTSKSKITVVLLDIEGTTTSIDFVKGTLFPYAEANVEHYLNQNWDTDDLKQDLKLLIQQAAEDVDNKVPNVVPINEAGSKDEMIQSVVRNVRWQMSHDRKTKALKSIQGHIWQDAYQNGSVKGHLYVDVLPCLVKWKSSGIKLYVYSSGSVEAQKLLFKYSTHGDLLHLFSGYFDTSVGSKVESTSYLNILTQIRCEAKEVLFLTDMEKEAEAAHGAGITSILLKRPPQPPLNTNEPPHSSFTQVQDFTEIDL